MSLLLIELCPKGAVPLSRTYRITPQLQTSQAAPQHACVKRRLLALSDGLFYHISGSLLPIGRSLLRCLQAPVTEGRLRPRHVSFAMGLFCCVGRPLLPIGRSLLRYLGHSPHHAGLTEQHSFLRDNTSPYGTTLAITDITEDFRRNVVRRPTFTPQPLSSLRAGVNVHAFTQACSGKDSVVIFYSQFSKVSVLVYSLYKATVERTFQNACRNHRVSAARLLLGRPGGCFRV